MVDPRRVMRGQKVHYDETYDYSFWAPLNWTQYEMTDQEGVIFIPEEDARTGFFVTAKDLGGDLEEPISEADLPALRDGILEGLEALPGCEIEYEKEISKQDGIGFEFMLTFDLDGERCKRRMFLLFRDKRQYTLYGQAVPVEDFDVFKNILGYMYTAFMFGDLRDHLPREPVLQQT